MKRLSRRPGGSVSRQQGMALFVALMVLVVVSILGTVSMRTALFQNRVSINSQMSALVGQGAETGLDAMTGQTRQLIVFGPDGIAGNGDEMLMTDPALLLVDALNNPANPRRACFNGVGATTVVDTVHAYVAQNPDPNPDLEDQLYFDEPCPAIPGEPVRITMVAGASPSGSNAVTEGFAIGSFVTGVVRVQAEAEIPGTSVSTIHAEEWAFNGMPGEEF